MRSHTRFNPSLQPTAYAASVSSMINSSDTFRVSSAPAHKAVAELYSLGVIGTRYAKATIA
jgi:hypothetical protein